MTLEEILSRLGFLSEVRQSLEEKVDNNVVKWEELAKTAYQGVDFDFILCHKSPFERLAVVTFLLVEKYEAYRKRGIPEQIIFDTFQDVSLRSGFYYEKTGEPGLTEDDVIWFRHIMNVEIFKIGCMQFQCFRMLYLEESEIEQFYMIYSNGVKTILPSGTPVINCHVQRGAVLNDLSVESALVEARSFFKRYFPEVCYQYFLCYSWLLYPPMIQCLPYDSHIRRFSEHFQIIGTCTDAEQAMENLFPEGEKQEWKRKSFLQQLISEHRERFGFACGIIPL